MQSPTDTSARDHDAPWSAEAKPAKRAKKVLTHRLAEMSEKFAAMERTLDRLATSDPFAPLADEVLEDPFAWIRRDPSITQYQGQHVALHPTRGVVAHGPRLDRMLAELRERDVSLDDVVLDFIADSPF
jgi:hypothetical protein